MHFRLKTIRNRDEKLAQANELLIGLVDHFYDKVAKSKSLMSCINTEVFF